MKENGNISSAMRVSAISIAVNLLLSAFKLFAGIIGSSSAMVSDAVHSASDVFSTIIVMIGIRVSNKKSDDRHQYGHERMECIASVLLSIVLFLTGIGIGYQGIVSVIGALRGNATQIPIPTLLPLIAAVVSIIVKEGMFWATKRIAKRINSTSLMADAWHHRSDAFSSIGSLIGIVGARLNFPILDPIASVVICILIVKAAYDILKDAISQMVDSSVSQEITNEIEDLALSVEGVKKVDLLMTRLFGSKFYVDIEIAVDGHLTLEDAHKISQRVHDQIEEKYSNAKHCMVHMNPYHE